MSATPAGIRLFYYIYAMASVHLIVTGKVQGVFYRATAKKVADKTGITGRVQNKDDGAVEIWASGPEEQLQKFISWCREGPAGARVEEVTTEWVDDLNDTEFSIVRK